MPAAKQVEPIRIAARVSPRSPVAGTPHERGLLTHAWDHNAQDAPVLPDQLATDDDDAEVAAGPGTPARELREDAVA